MVPTIIQEFVELLRELSTARNQSFSGAGFVLYHDLEVLANYHCNLVDDGQQVPPLKLGTKALTNYVVEIAQHQHAYHDGFHFINADGVLTHVAQFFSPPVHKSIANIPGQGARTFCSQCGSKMEGVLMVGSVSSNYNIYLFKKGRLVNERFKLNKVYG